MRFRHILALAAVMALSGCFSSEAPLYAENAAVCPFREQTQFGTATVDAGGVAHIEATFRIAPDGGVCVQTEAGEARRIVFTAIESGWYVAQEFRGQNNRYYYGLVRIEGDRIWSYEPNCGDFTQAALDEVGVASPWAEMFALTPAPEATTPKLSAPANPGAKPTNGDAAGDEQTTGNDGSCTVTSATQVETLFRRWIQLGRPASSYGVRMPAPAAPGPN